MLGKTFILLKRNPLLIVFPVVAIVLLLVSEYPLISYMDKIMELSGNMPRNMTQPPELQLQDAFDIFSGALVMLLFSLGYCIFAIVFVSGYGNMLAAAVNEGKASLKVFFFGIRKLTGKVLLSFLLLIAIILGFSIVVSLVTTPLLFANIGRGSFNQASFINTQKTIQIGVSIVMLFLYPFIIMWLPAVFLERGEGVTACFRHGIKAGVRNYLPLVAVVLLTLLPTLYIFIFTDIYSIFKTPYYMLIFVYQAVLLPIISAYLFVRYADKKAQSRNRSINV